MATRTEFRVKWRREGRQGTARIYQTEEPAYAKADRLLALDAVKEGTARFGDMPDLVASPIVEVREVGEWTTAERQISEPSDEACAGMEEFAVPGSQTGYAF